MLNVLSPGVCAPEVARLHLFAGWSLDRKQEQLCSVLYSQQVGALDSHLCLAFILAACYCIGIRSRSVVGSACSTVHVTLQLV